MAICFSSKRSSSSSPSPSLQKYNDFFPSPPQEMFTQYRRGQTPTVPKDTFGKRSCQYNVLQKRRVRSLSAHGWEKYIQSQVLHTLLHRQFQVLQGTLHRQGTELVLIAYQRMLKLDYFYSFLRLTKIAQMPQHGCHQDHFGAKWRSTSAREKLAICEAAIKGSNACLKKDAP